MERNEVKLKRGGGYHERPHYRTWDYHNRIEINMREIYTDIYNLLVITLILENISQYCWLTKCFAPAATGGTWDDLGHWNCMSSAFFPLLATLEPCLPAACFILTVNMDIMESNVLTLLHLKYLWKGSRTERVRWSPRHQRYQLNNNNVPDGMMAGWWELPPTILATPDSWASCTKAG